MALPDTGDQEERQTQKNRKVLCKGNAVKWYSYDI